MGRCIGHERRVRDMTATDPMAGLKRSPDLQALFERQPESVQEVYVAWYTERVEIRAAHRDCLEPFIAGYRAGQGSRRPAVGIH